MTAQDRKAQAAFAITPPDLVALARHCDSEGQAVISRWLTAIDLKEMALDGKSDASPAQLRYLAGLTGVSRDEWEWGICIPFDDCKTLLDDLLENGKATYRGATYRVTATARTSRKRSAKRQGKVVTDIPW